jgi:acylphosphatase
VDRFAGFRYEVSGHVVGVGFRQAASEAAEELGCFGWAQNTPRNTVVGEVRCAKVLAPQMREWLRNGPPSARVDQVRVKERQVKRGGEVKKGGRL